MNIQLAKVSDTMKTMNKSDAMKQTFSLSKMVKTVCVLRDRKRMGSGCVAYA